MTHVRLKLTIAGVVIIGAVALLGLAGVSEGWVYYLPVDDFVQDASYQDQRVRLHGTVGEDALESSESLLSAKFDLLGESGKIRVEYDGVIPDMFQAGRDVVVEGELDDDGIFQADTLMTKCASKYETEDGQAPHANPHAEEQSE